MNEQRQWMCRCRRLIAETGVTWGRLHEPDDPVCLVCGDHPASGIPETVFRGVPVEVGEVPDQGPLVFGPLVDDEIRMSQVSDPVSWGLVPEVEEALKRRLAEGFPKAQYADTTGLQDHPLMKKIERKG